ncbi:BamA/TamA family outer membrane protein [Vibrio vulnificus]|uniref:BamA/TamA family outer membrane protein n=1 Tax=Vibrio vulnificus TaxID=672 RepID=UPI000D3ECFF5|nr:BamA/TamA family outer membrane protein [Vibrio vulnificus]ELK8308825.1 BamA/TamA family outer membrane protein [Vibrio vulnificus]ELL0585531.1 BamA/TamA family outer membrane protein [Vibrio vulnificus]MBN8140425.1 BamA/TamA family outer membrane protein [Vibrio vulnificus]MBN8149601.1 BamA/TamA family outer membrane protein [Vibrio vulnificus]MCG9655405.1 BamA/TamA family outer membrane protein [Vibrio vulnificus]
MSKVGYCALLALTSVSAFAKPQSSWVDNLLEKLGSSDTVDTSKLIDWGVLPGPFVNPEQGLGIGIAAVGLYTPTGWQSADPYSTLTLTSYASTSGSYGLGVENRTYLCGDRIRLLIDGWVSHTPGYYWGQGESAAQTDSNKTQYNAQRYQFNPKIAYEIAPSVYLKAGWHWQTYQGVTVDDETPVAKALSNGRSSGMLLGMEYDSRDFEPNPEMGSYWNLEWSDFRHQYGSDTNYQQWLMNVRHYLRVSSQTIVAMELYSQAFTGDVPWYDQAMLGDDQRMRGYYQGQYRDRNQLSTQVEVRHSFNQRHGMVAWVGAGTIAPHYNELLEQSWLPTVGIGYRFAFKARINVRVDMGFGKESSGFYFHVNEAF